MSGRRWRRSGPRRPITIGRAADNDIGISDVLASRHHARLVATPAGMQIQDANSVNGTFVNGERIKQKTLQENDVVTIGNLDFVFTDGDLVRRAEPATTAGGLEARDVGLTLEDGDVTLLDRVSLTSRPGALTAVIGPSGLGQVHAVEGDRRGLAADEWRGEVRRARPARRVRVDSQPNRHGAAGRRRAPGAHRRPSAEHRGQTANAARHHQTRTAASDLAGARRTRDDRARRHTRRQAVGWAAQAGIGRDGTVDRTVAAGAGRTHDGFGSRAGPSR